MPVVMSPVSAAKAVSAIDDTVRVRTKTESKREEVALLEQRREEEEKGRRRRRKTLLDLFSRKIVSERKLGFLTLAFSSLVWVRSPLI